MIIGAITTKLSWVQKKPMSNRVKGLLFFTAASVLTQTQRLHNEFEIARNLKSSIPSTTSENGTYRGLSNLRDLPFSEFRLNQEQIDDSAKGGLAQIWEHLTVNPCASKDFKR